MIVINKLRKYLTISCDYRGICQNSSVFVVTITVLKTKSSVENVIEKLHLLKKTLMENSIFYAFYLTIYPRKGWLSDKNNTFLNKSVPTPIGDQWRGQESRIYLKWRAFQQKSCCKTLHLRYFCGSCLLLTIGTR